MEYHGYTYEVVGTNIYVSGPVGFGLLAPKEEGKTFKQCAEKFIDRLISKEVKR